MLAACGVAPRAVPKHGAPFTPIVMLLQCMQHYRRKIPHLVSRIHIAARFYEQLGHISRIVFSRPYQCCLVVLRSHARPILASDDMRVYSHNTRMIDVH